MRNERNRQEFNRWLNENMRKIEASDDTILQELRVLLEDERGITKFGFRLLEVQSTQQEFNMSSFTDRRYALREERFRERADTLVRKVYRALGLEIPESLREKEIEVSEDDFLAHFNDVGERGEYNRDFTTEPFDLGKIKD